MCDGYFRNFARKSSKTFSPCIYFRLNTNEFFRNNYKFQNIVLQEANITTLATFILNSNLRSLRNVKQHTQINIHNIHTSTYTNQHTQHTYPNIHKSTYTTYIPQHTQINIHNIHTSTYTNQHTQHTYLNIHKSTYTTYIPQHTQIFLHARTVMMIIKKRSNI